MGTHNICLYKEVDKKYTGCNLKTTELLDCALIGVCAVIRSTTVNEDTQELPQSGNSAFWRHEPVLYILIFFISFSQNHMLWVLVCF